MNGFLALRHSHDGFVCLGYHLIESGLDDSSRPLFAFNAPQRSKHDGLLLIEERYVGLNDFPRIVDQLVVVFALLLQSSDKMFFKITDDTGFHVSSELLVNLRSQVWHVHSEGTSV